MKQIVRYSLLLLLAAVILTSCKNNTPKEAKYIPKDASFVLVLDPQQMQDKLQKGGISVDTLLSRIFKNDSANSKDKALFNEVRMNAGINWNEKFFLFMVQKNNADNSMSNTVSMLASLQDAGKLQAFLKKQDKLKTNEIKKETDFSYMVLHDGGIVSWNDKQVIFSIYNHNLKATYDTVAMTFKKPVPVNTEAEMKQEVTRFFTQKPGESLADVSIFTDMFKEKADGYAFTSANSSLAVLSNMPLQIPKLEELLKDNYTTSTLSFDDGKITAKTSTYTNPLLSSVLKQYSGPIVNMAMLENYPSSNINGFMLAAFNPEIMGGMLKQLEVEGLVNTFLQKTGLNSQDIYKSLKGDIAVVISDLGMSGIEPQMKTDEKSMMKKKPFVKMLLSAPVGDKTSFNKILDKAAEQGMLVKKNNIYKAAGVLATMGLFVMADDKNLIIASDSLTYTQYISKSSKAVLKQEILDRFKGKSTAFYFDIANTLNGFSKDAGDGFHQSITTAKNTFKDVIASSDNFDGKTVKASFEIRMQNEKQNSLVTLTSLLTDIAVDMRVQAKKEKDMEEKLFPGGVPAIIRTN